MKYLHIFVLLGALQAQQAANAPRGMHSDVFAKLRSSPPPRAAAGSTKAAGAAPKRVYIGLNLWRMRPAAQPSSVSVRGLKHREDPGGARLWEPGRMGMRQMANEGDHMRLSVESGIVGYLYMVSRDVYRDGTKSAPMLIFPTQRLRGGRNRVAPGTPVEIPEFTDTPPAFTVERTRADQDAIELVMVVTPERLPGITTQTNEQELPPEVVAEWERKWGRGVQASEDESTTGKLYTRAERDAAGALARPLRPQDPLPLTLFYRNALADEGMCVVARIALAPK